MNKVWRERIGEQVRVHERECHVWESRLQELLRDRQLLIEALNRNTEAITSFKDTLERFMQAER